MTGYQKKFFKPTTNSVCERLSFTIIVSVVRVSLRSTFHDNNRLIKMSLRFNFYMKATYLDQFVLILVFKIRLGDVC